MVLSLLKRSVLFGLLIFSSQAATARPITFDIDATSNNSTKIGIQIGQEIQKNFPHVAKQYDNYLAFLLSPSQFKQLIPQVESLKVMIDANYQAEINAIASVLQLNTFDKLGDDQLSMNEFWLLQFLSDLTAINKGSAFASLNRNDKNPLVARNVDWKSTPDLRALQTITVYRYEERTLIIIGLAGLGGVINGFNEQGLFVSLLNASEQQLSTTLAPINSSNFDLRTALQNNEKLTTANSFLAQRFYPRGHAILFADRENVAVLEQPANSLGTLRKIDSPLVNEMQWHSDEQLAVVDCFVLKTSPHNCHATTDYYHWGRLAQLLKPFYETGISVKEAITLMQDATNSHQAIFNENTLQSLVFTPKDKTLYLYTQSTEQNEFASPLFEKYQFIATQPNAGDKFLDMGLLMLGISILGAAWWYIFRSGKITLSKA
jgi:hypothetical protein